MRSYILTDTERKLLTKYLTSDETSDAFWVLMNRINKSVKTLEVDIELVHKTISKYRNLSAGTL